MVDKNKQYPSDLEAKKAIIDVGQRMYQRGFVAANDGNISCKTGPNTLWTTPTGVSKGFMKPDMLLKVDGEGNVLMGRGKPSSELKMHLRVYTENPEIGAVTHAHPPAATSYAIAGIALDRPILPEGVVQLGTVPVAHYATPGTNDVPDSIAPYCKTHNGVMLANHGALTWGADIYQAYYRLESMEYYALVSMYTQNILGKVNELSCGQIEELVKIREALGIETGGIPPCSIQTTNAKDVVSNPVEVVPSVSTPIASTAGCSISAPSFVKDERLNRLTDEEKLQLKEEVMDRVIRKVMEKMALEG